MNTDYNETTKQITQSYFNSLSNNDRSNYMLQGYSVVNKIKPHSQTQYYDDVTYNPHKGYTFTNKDQFKLWLKQDNNLDTFIDTNMDTYYISDRPTKKNNRVGIPQVKNSVSQQKLHSANIDQMCIGVKMDGVRCIWKNQKGSCYCGRHNEKIKLDRNFHTIITKPNWIFDPLYKGDTDLNYSPPSHNHIGRNVEKYPIPTTECEKRFCMLNPEYRCNGIKKSGRCIWLGGFNGYCGGCVKTNKPIEGFDSESLKEKYKIFKKGFTNFVNLYYVNNTFNEELYNNAKKKSNEVIEEQPNDDIISLESEKNNLKSQVNILENQVKTLEARLNKIEDGDLYLQ